MMKFLFFSAIFFVLFADAKYTNCEFQNKAYSDVCKRVITKGVTYQYANEFLLSYFKVKKFDEVSWKYLQPRHIKTHRENEKRANNALVSYIPKMVRHLKKYKKVYDFSEKKYGVNREVIAAILLKETKLGVIKPKHDAFIVFNTMVVRTPNPKTSRERWLLEMGKSNMAEIIHYCYKKKLQPSECNLPSSYAGAVGIAQFMPSSFIYTQGYKTKEADLTKMEDAIVSASKYLHKKASFHQLIDFDKIQNMPEIESQWYDYAFENSDASFVYESGKNGKKYACFACKVEKLAYLKSYVQKIMRYNNSSNYAVGVLRLAYDAHYKLQGK